MFPEASDATSSPARRWYVVRSQPRNEALALRHLHNQGLASFCPMARPAPRKGRQPPPLRALFPSYLFVKIDVERDRWRSINGTIGVAGLIGISRTGSGRPTPLPAGLVERMQASTARNGELRFGELLAKGDHVRIVGGPFDQLCGFLETGTDAERVTILLDMLAQQTRVQLSRDMLVAA